MPVLTAWEMEANAAWSLDMERFTELGLNKGKVNESSIERATCPLSMGPLLADVVAAFGWSRSSLLK